jgi:UDP-glucose 4-epimerase
MKACVIGGNGFIGTHLVDGLRRTKWDVVVFDRAEGRYQLHRQDVEYVYGDLSNRELLSEVLRHVDVVFHLAYTTVPQTSNNDPAFDVRTNVLDFIGLLEVCVKVNIPRIIFLSSGGTVYGIPSQNPVSERHSTDPTSSYGITKLTIEKYLALFNRLYGLEYMVLRPANPYGEHQNPLGSQGAVTVFLGRIARGLPIVVWGDGTVIRDYIYVGDLVGACLAALPTQSKYRIFNVGSGHGTSLNQLIKTISQVVPVEFQVQYESARIFDVPELVLDISHAEYNLNWSAKISLEEGIKRTWDWVQTVT